MKNFLNNIKRMIFFILLLAGSIYIFKSEWLKVVSTYLKLLSVGSIPWILWYIGRKVNIPYFKMGDDYKIAKEHNPSNAWLGACILLGALAIASAIALFAV